jgi:hypothetical protein
MFHTILCVNVVAGGEAYHTPNNVSFNSVDKLVRIFGLDILLIGTIGEE